MRKISRHPGRIIANAVLLLVLGGLLVAYATATSDLPVRIYTPVQQKYLAYNSTLDISQAAPTWNMAWTTDGAVRVFTPEEQRQFQRASRVRATLEARQEEHAGVSVTVYDLAFEATYTISHPLPRPVLTQLFFPFPSNLETLHEVEFLVNGEEVSSVQYSGEGIRWEATLQVGERVELTVRYRAHGANSFVYSPPKDQRSDVDVVIDVVGLTGSTVPRDYLPTTAVEPLEGGERLAWQYRGLIADRDIQVELPARLSFAQRIAAFQEDFRTLALLAPVLVSGFLVVLAGLLYLGGIRLRFESYLLVGCGLALFYPALTFLSGLLGVTLAAVLALSLAAVLVVPFLGLAAGWRQTWWRAGLLLVVFLGTFSLGLLTPWRGLLLTGGGILLLGTLMVAYVRRPAEPAAPPPDTSPPVDGPDPSPAVDVPEEDPAGPLAGAEPAASGRHCPYCGRSLAEDHTFCPYCGHGTAGLRRCPACGHEQLVPGDGPAYCLHCGEALPS